MTEHGQRIMIWWALIFMIIFGIAWYFLLGMIPIPPATLTPNEIAAFYTENGFKIRLGSAVASWTSAFMVPFSVVVAIQLARLEKGVPVWSILQFAGGILMSIFLVLPPIFWGVAAYTPTRPPEVTALMHELANLTLTTTDQFFIFQMVAITYVSLTRKHDELSAFPRWLGWFTIWAALMFEVGAIAFIPKTGPFAWNGLFVFWLPLTIFGTWVTVMCISLLRALKRQQSRHAVT